MSRHDSSTLFKQIRSLIFFLILFNNEWFKFELNCLNLLVELLIDKLATKTFHSSKPN